MYVCSSSNKNNQPQSNHHNAHVMNRLLHCSQQRSIFSNNPHSLSICGVSLVAAAVAVVVMCHFRCHCNFVGKMFLLHEQLTPFPVPSMLMMKMKGDAFVHYLKWHRNRSIDCVSQCVVENWPMSLSNYHYHHRPYDGFQVMFVALVFLSENCYRLLVRLVMGKRLCHFFQV